MGLESLSYCMVRTNRETYRSQLFKNRSFFATEHHQTISNSIQQHQIVFKLLKNSHITIPPQTETFSECFVPNCGISRKVS